MATKKCSNGHIYDSGIYGNTCPYCPSIDQTQQHFPSQDSDRTRVNNQMEGGTMATSTIPMGDEESGGGATVIRHLGDSATGETGLTNNNRRLVGILVTYDLNPMGQAYNIYEGRNLIGRKATTDICLTSDSQISSEHLIILFREAEGVFWAIDNNSSNGTFINGNFENKTPLKSGDIIMIGTTRLIFLAIPQLPAKNNI